MGALDLMATTDLVGGGDCVTRFGGGEHRATQWGKGVVANCLKMGTKRRLLGGRDDTFGENGSQVGVGR